MYCKCTFLCLCHNNFCSTLIINNIYFTASSKLTLQVNGTEHLTIDEKKFKRELLNMFAEELQESERDMKNAIDGLRRSLTSDFRNPSELRSNSKHRLEFLRFATMKEEQSFNRLKVTKLKYIQIKLR